MDVRHISPPHQSRSPAATEPCRAKRFASADIVGSVVLPVLGAVPDGAIVLFSGMGPKAAAQGQLSVGVRLAPLCSPILFLSHFAD